MGPFIALLRALVESLWDLLRRPSLLLMRSIFIG
jgi:hypothetical protein